MLFVLIVAALAVRSTRMTFGKSRFIAGIDPRMANIFTMTVTLAPRSRGRRLGGT